jgi:GT2 family glycosyltransferase
MTLSIIIVNWNVKDCLEKCLESIFGMAGDPIVLRSHFASLHSGSGLQNDRGDVEVFVVDNASTDGSVEMLEKNYESRIKNYELKIIENKENVGFAKANNQAIKQIQSNYRLKPELQPEFILLLNPDTEIMSNNRGIASVGPRQTGDLPRNDSEKHGIAMSSLSSVRTPRNDKSSLEKMVDFMRRHPDSGVAGCKLLNSDRTLQPSIRRFPTLLSQIITLTKAPNIFPWLIKKYAGLDIDYNKTQEVDQIMGSFFMIRKKVIDQIGLLDENFWSWFEEVDYCKRVKQAGWKIYYYPEVEIIHHKGQSFSQLLDKQKRFNKSLLYYFKKHHLFFAWLILWLMQPLSMFLTWLDERVGIKKRLGKKKYL